MKRSRTVGVGGAVECRKFIATEPLGKSGETAEQSVWAVVCRAFTKRDCIAYWRYPIFSKVGEFRKEPDILIADFKLGLTIIEVKSIVINQILGIVGHRWQFKNFYTTSGNPYQQAENQLLTLLGYCDREISLQGKVRGRAIVALPLITRQQWHDKKFNKLPSCPPILFKDDLFPAVGKHLKGIGDFGGECHAEEIGREIEIDRSFDPVVSSELVSSFNPSFLIQQIKQVIPVIKGGSLNREQWSLLQAVISGTPILRTPSRKFYLEKGRKFSQDPNSFDPPAITRAQVLAQLQQQLLELDLQQEHIGKVVPPGPQRIRGIAGSGKTVLLCQKAAQMHLKHPDWDIALVFFSRSLYGPIVSQLDRWLRRFSNGEVGYNPQQGKLRVLHAWGAKNQPGFYSTLCQAARVWRLTVDDTDCLQPNDALADVCRQLLQMTRIPQIFDAILIDEGQDLIVDEAFKFEGKQPFYWMAYQSLRPIDRESPELRRLIWAYDEAQSLESLQIPTASELLGEELGHLVSGEYPNGIKKTEILCKCYRTPGPILTVAHGIGMGLLRPKGMLTGMTRPEDWQAIGYELLTHPSAIDGLKAVPGEDSENFRLDDSPEDRGDRTPIELSIGQLLTLYRPPENSPNIIPKLWGKSVLEFEAYRSRQEEFAALADNILYNLRVDSLRPSREILVIVLGSGFEAMELETDVASFLIAQGIDIYIPSTSHCNLLKPDPEDANPNRFWCEGGVTVSRIYRAKGHEADMVYLVGLDNIAKDESNLGLRNQLFVALTRAKGWVRLSGIGAYPFYEELWQVMQSGERFTFTFRRPLKRDISITDAGELMRRYRTGGRNFQGADLAGIQLPGVTLEDANLIRSRLIDANLRKANLDGSKLVIANLTQADLSGSSLKKARLVGAILNHSDLSGANLTRANLSDAQLRKARLVNANLYEANLSGADLSGADLSGANLERTDLSDVKFQGTRMPDGSLFEEGGSK